jgi:hypothetical protein
MATVFNVDELINTAAIDKAALRVGPATGGPVRSYPLPPGYQQASPYAGYPYTHTAHTGGAQATAAAP